MVWVSLFSVRVVCAFAGELFEGIIIVEFWVAVRQKLKSQSGHNELIAL